MYKYCIEYLAENLIFLNQLFFMSCTWFDEILQWRFTTIHDQKHEARPRKQWETQPQTDRRSGLRLTGDSCRGLHRASTPASLEEGSWVSLPFPSPFHRSITKQISAWMNSSHRAQYRRNLLRKTVLRITQETQFWPARICTCKALGSGVSEPDMWAHQYLNVIALDNQNVKISGS